MEQHRATLVLLGPVLLYFAVFVLPGSNIDPEARLGIMRAFTWRWYIGHGLMLVTILALLIWLADVCAWAFDGLEWHTLAGALVFALALFGEFSRSTIQLFAMELDIRQTAIAQSTLELFNGNWTLIGLVFAPALGYSIGLCLLAWALFRAGRSKKQMFLLGTGGIFLSAAELLQLQFLAWIAAFSILVFTWLHLHSNAGEATEEENA